MKFLIRIKIPTFPPAVLLALLASLLFGSPSEAAEPPPAETTRSLLQLYQDGGPVMHLIALCSLIGASLATFCALHFRRASLLPASLVEELNRLLSLRDLAAAHTVCEKHPGPMTRSLLCALTKANYARDMFNKTAMENAIADACMQEETKMMALVNHLNTLAVLAPMIGLLGTVSGMIRSFGSLQTGKGNAPELAKGIGEALVATGGGLFLAIPAMFLFFLFRGMVSKHMADVHRALAHMLDRFTGEAHGSPPPPHSMPHPGTQPVWGNPETVCS
jgi:biopolymer transport protein ExbB